MRWLSVSLLFLLLPVTATSEGQDAEIHRSQPPLPASVTPIAPTEYNQKAATPSTEAPTYLMPPQSPKLLPSYKNGWLAAPARGTVIDPSRLPTIRLNDVLVSVENTYPLLTIAELDRTIAQATFLMAQGNFDLKIKAGTAVNELGYYESQRFEAGFEQGTRLWGMDLFGGYALSNGTFPSYRGALQTRENGEWMSGLRVPLLRGRVIDERRAELQLSDLGQSLANFSIDEQRIAFTLGATQAYWAWLAAGQRYALAQKLLEIATLRDNGLREASELGSFPRIDVTDNRRAILQRQSTVLGAERALQKSAIRLSLFLRDSAGNPFIPRASQLPAEFPPYARIGLEQLDAATEKALRQRPELRYLATQRAQLEVDASLARNDRNPDLDLEFSFSRGLGERPVASAFRGPEEIKAGLFFSFPIQRRKATAKLQAAEAKAAQVRTKERYQQDKIAADVRDALLAVQMAYDRLQLLRQEVDVTRELQDLERDRFTLGDSNLFLVNLREQASFDAELRAVSAMEEFFLAFATFQATTAEVLYGNLTGTP